MCADACFTWTGAVIRDTGPVIIRLWTAAAARDGGADGD